MRYQQPLKHILRDNSSVWKVDTTRPAIRHAFTKVLECKTPVLGAEVYSSGSQERMVFHTCKSRACSSCGARATSKWQRERWAALPDVPYKGITFTMPGALWPLFRNRQLVRLLPALAARVVESWARAKFGVQLGIIAIPHTFNSRLEFNSHVHVMVTAGGITPRGRWRESFYYDRNALMIYWRQSVVRLLRKALQSGYFGTESSQTELETLLTEQENRWWSVKVQSLGSKEHFLRYAGRYARRPPIAQRRITHISSHKIAFIAKDKKSRRFVNVELTPKEFISAWMQHIPDRYEHAVRSFGLFSPRMLGTHPSFLRSVPNQPRKRPQLRPLPWNISIKRDFGWDPLLDPKGIRMTWARRIAPAGQLGITTTI